jgi:hypothetical protein
MTRLPRLELDYVTAQRRSRALGLLLLVLSLVTAGVLVERYRTVSQALQQIEAAQALLGPERLALRARSPARLDEEAKQVEAVLRQLALPWGAIIESVEDASCGSGPKRAHRRRCSSICSGWRQPEPFPTST